jgi:hypothetical protein
MFYGASNGFRAGVAAVLPWRLKGVQTGFIVPIAYRCSAAVPGREVAVWYGAGFPRRTDHRVLDTSRPVPSNPVLYGG